MHPFLVLLGGKSCSWYLILQFLFAMQHEPSSESPKQPASLQDQLPALNSNVRHRIFLIRHGETDWNRQGKLQGGQVDIPLNPRGHYQAQRVAQELQTAGVSWDLIVSSPLQRARQTADALVVVGNGRSRTTMSGFREMDYGRHEGLSMKGSAESRALFRSFVQQMEGGNLDLAWPGGGESIRHVERRAVEALQEVLASSSEDISSGDDTQPTTTTKTVGIVAHAILNKVLLAATLQGDGKYFVDYEQDNCCINVVDHLVDGSFQAVVMNYNQHMKNDDNDDAS